MEKIANLEKLDEVLAQEDSFIIYKHSTTCSVSAGALGQMKKIEKEFPNLKIYEVLVIEDRPISLEIASRVKVVHKSPQLLLVKNQKCLWDISHFAIKFSAIKEQLAILGISY